MKKGSQEFINVLRIYSSHREGGEGDRGRRQTVLLRASVSCVIHTPTTQHVNSISLHNLADTNHSADSTKKHRKFAHILSWIHFVYAYRSNVRAEKGKESATVYILIPEFVALQLAPRLILHYWGGTSVKGYFTLVAHSLSRAVYRTHLNLVTVQCA